MTITIKVSAIETLHKENILLWKKGTISSREQGFLALVEKNHAFNYQLWHAEDRARRDDMGAEFVFHAKREIDACNQQRNNYMEKMDEWIFMELAPAAHEQCPVHSETPGMMIDRLSILALKSYHMGLQVTRADAEESHKLSCQEKLIIIHTQQQQLLSCLEQLLSEIALKTRTFRIYHQFKMYNDPNLNPELYLNRTKEQV